MTKREEPIGHTCPDIDVALRSLRSLKSEIESYMRDAHKSETDNVPIDRTTLCNWIDDIDEISDGKNCSLEYLRDSNSTLREWGNDLVSDLDDQDREIDRLSQEISRLEKCVQEKEDEIGDLKITVILKEETELSNHQP